MTQPVADPARGARRRHRASCRCSSKRLEGAGWQYRVLASPVPLDAIVAMRLNAIVIDLAVLGPQGWNYLEKLCTRLPGLGVIVCTGRSSVAQRVRGPAAGRRRLDDQAVPSRRS